MWFLCFSFPSPRVKGVISSVLDIAHFISEIRTCSVFGHFSCLFYREIWFQFTRNLSCLLYIFCSHLADFTACMCFSFPHINNFPCLNPGTFVFLQLHIICITAFQQNTCSCYSICSPSIQKCFLLVVSYTVLMLFSLVLFRFVFRANMLFKSCLVWFDLTEDVHCTSAFVVTLN